MMLLNHEKGKKAPARAEGISMKKILGKLETENWKQASKLNIN